MFADRSERLLDGAIRVSSAGTWAQSGREPMPEAIGAARQHGIDIRDLRSTRLTARLVDRADLVLTMTSEQRAEVIDLDPAATSKTFTLKELVRLLADLPPTDVLEALPKSFTVGELEQFFQEESGPVDRDSALRRIRAANERRAASPDWHGVDDEIIDPLGLSMAAYQAVAWEIETAIDSLMYLLFRVGGKKVEPAADQGRER